MERTAILDGELVDVRRIDPEKHDYLSDWLPPTSDTPIRKYETRGEGKQSVVFGWSYGQWAIAVGRHEDAEKWTPFPDDRGATTLREWWIDHYSYAPGWSPIIGHRDMPNRRWTAQFWWKQASTGRISPLAEKAS